MASGEVIQEHHAAGDHVGMVVGQADDPEPSRMCRVESAAAIMKISGDAIVSPPAEWCSPM